MKPKSRLLLLLILCAALLPAQNRSTAEIRGTVTDPSGSAVPGVAVTIRNTLTGITTKTSTNATGLYTALYLQPGSYAMTFEAQGFQRLERTGIELGLDQAARVDAQLVLGEIRQTVSVSENVMLVDTETSERKLAISPKMVQELPAVGRSIYAFGVLAAGISTSQQRTVAGGFDPGRVNVNGSRAFAINVTVNGGATNLPHNASFAWFQPGLESVREFNVITDNFGAEFASGTSVMNVLIKGGTNEMHGSLFEYLQNDKLNARNFFAQTKPPLRRNQFGGTIGGPFVRNKAFFFASTDTTIVPSSAISIVTVPTEAVRAGDFSAPGLPQIIDPSGGAPFPGNRLPASRLDSVALATQKYWPAPSQPSLVNNYYSSSPARNMPSILNLKGDYTITSRHNLSAAFNEIFTENQFAATIPGPACMGTYCGSYSMRSTQATLSETWTATPTVLNEFRGNVVRWYYPLTVPSQGGGYPEKLGLKTVPQDFFPTFNIGGAIPTSLVPGNNWRRIINVVSLSDTVSLVKRNHLLKFGGEFTKNQHNEGPGWQSGTFGFSGLFSKIGYSDFLLGLPNSYSLNANPQVIGVRRWTFQAFVQDRYKVSRNITLNLGVRYQVEPGFSEVYNRMAGFDPSLNNPVTNTPGAIFFLGPDRKTLQDGRYALFAPRFGLAWTPRANTSIRLGYGLFYMAWVEATSSTIGAPGFAILQSMQTTDLVTPVFKLSSGPPMWSYPDPAKRSGAISNGQNVTYWPRKDNVPSTQQWQLSIQRQLPGDIVVETAYVGSKGTHLPFTRGYNQVPPELLGPGDAKLRQPFPHYLGVSATFKDAVSIYHSFQLQVNKRFSRGLNFTTSYTVSKSMDNSSFDNTLSLGNEWQIATRTDLNRALSQFDTPQRIVSTLIYELPFGAGRQFLNRGAIADGVLGGWRFSSLFSGESGTPFTVLVGGANLSNSLAGSWFPNRISNGNLPVEQRSLGRWFDTAAFVTPAPYTFGNSGRDILRGPGAWHSNFSLAKQFSLPWIGDGRSTLLFRADVNSVFNHPTFYPPNATTGSAATGTITGAMDARAIQLGLRWGF